MKLLDVGQPFLDEVKWWGCACIQGVCWVGHAADCARSIGVLRGQSAK